MTTDRPTHYHWNSDMTGLRSCPLDDELSEPTFYVPSPQVNQAEPPPLSDGLGSGWIDAGWLTEDEYVDWVKLHRMRSESE